MKRTKQLQRRYPGEEEATYLLLVLNGETVVTAKRITPIIAALKAVQGIRPAGGRKATAGDLLQPNKNAAIETVSGLLGDFAGKPYIAAPLPGQFGPQLKWRPFPKSGRLHLGLELEAVLIAVRLAQMQRLDRVRQCAWCERWFFQKFNFTKGGKENRFCSDACKTNFYNNPEPEERERKRKGRLSNEAYKSNKRFV